MGAMAARDRLAQYEAMSQPRDKPRRASVRGYLLTRHATSPAFAPDRTFRGTLA